MSDKNFSKNFYFAFCLILAFAIISVAQSNDQKKNHRDVPAESVTKSQENQKTAADKPVYFYEFSQPDFTISKISIEHDESGKGKITFLKKYVEEDITDPIQISPKALERIKGIWQTLNYLEAGENYQYEKDYSHLGNMKFSAIKDGSARKTTFNWTTNPDAKALADEYRKISRQFTWIFDINLARENQPLEAPKAMNLLDSYLKRDELSDPVQLIPFLKKLSDDERIPLIARNKAAKLVGEIEKKAEREEKKAEKQKNEDENPPPLSTKKNSNRLL